MIALNQNSRPGRKPLLDEARAPRNLRSPRDRRHADDGRRLRRLFARHDCSCREARPRVRQRPSQGLGRVRNPLPAKPEQRRARPHAMAGRCLDARAAVARAVPRGARPQPPRADEVGEGGREPRELTILAFHPRKVGGDARRRKSARPQPPRGWSARWRATTDSSPSLPPPAASRGWSGSGRASTNTARNGAVRNGGAAKHKIVRTETVKSSGKSRSSAAPRTISCSAECAATPQNSRHESPAIAEKNALFAGSRPVAAATPANIAPQNHPPIGEKLPNPSRK